MEDTGNGFFAPGVVNGLIIELQPGLFSKKDLLKSKATDTVQKESVKKKKKTDSKQGDLFNEKPKQEDQPNLFDYKPGKQEKAEIQEGLRSKQTISTAPISGVDVSERGYHVLEPGDAASLLAYLVAVVQLIYDSDKKTESLRRFNPAKVGEQMNYTRGLAKALSVIRK